MKNSNTINALKNIVLGILYFICVTSVFITINELFKKVFTIESLEYGLFEFDFSFYMVTALVLSAVPFFIYISAISFIAKPGMAQRLLIAFLSQFVFYVFAGGPIWGSGIVQLSIMRSILVLLIAGFILANLDHILSKKILRRSPQSASLH